MAAHDARPDQRCGVHVAFSSVLSVLRPFCGAGVRILSPDSQLYGQTNAVCDIHCQFFHFAESRREPNSQNQKQNAKWTHGCTRPISRVIESGNVRTRPISRIRRMIEPRRTTTIGHGGRVSTVYRGLPNYYTLWKSKIHLFIGPFGTPLETENIYTSRKIRTSTVKFAH